MTLDKQPSRQTTNYYVCSKCGLPCETYLPAKAFTVTAPAMEKLRLSECCSAPVRVVVGKD